MSIRSDFTNNSSDQADRNMNEIDKNWAISNPKFQKLIFFHWTNISYSQFSNLKFGIKYNTKIIVKFFLKLHDFSRVYQGLQQPSYRSLRIFNYISRSRALKVLNVMKCFLPYFSRCYRLLFPGTHLARDIIYYTLEINRLALLSTFPGHCKAH